MVDGETQNFQGFMSDLPGIIVKYITPYGYCLRVENPLTNVICPGVSTDTDGREGAYCS